MKEKIYKPKTNWQGWIDWQQLYTEFTIICCDCGLAHKFQIKKDKNKKLFWRCKRNKEATKLARK